MVISYRSPMAHQYVRLGMDSYIYRVTQLDDIG